MSRRSLDNLGLCCSLVGGGMSLALIYGGIDSNPYSIISGTLVVLGLMTAFMPKR